MRRIFVCLLLAGASSVGGLLAQPTSAHHSFNAYDMSKTLIAIGTLKEFRWGAPHTSMVVTYQNDDGQSAEMSLICGSPLTLFKQGFTPRDFQKGDKIKLSYHPNVSGFPGGSLAHMTAANGRSYSEAEAVGAVPPPAK